MCNSNSTFVIKKRRYSEKYLLECTERIHKDGREAFLNNIPKHENPYPIPPKKPYYKDLDWIEKIEEYWTAYDKYYNWENGWHFAQILVNQANQNNERIVIKLNKKKVIIIPKTT